MKPNATKAPRKSDGKNSAAVLKSAGKNAVPVRFDDTDCKLIDELAARTGLSKADVVRRALRFAGPRFLDRRANIAELTDRVPADKAA
jgi:hypothetical protein